MILISGILAVPASAEFYPSCETLTDQQRLERAQIAGVGEITSYSCTCSRKPSCSFKVALAAMKKGEPQNITYTEINRHKYTGAGLCAQLETSARARIGTSEYFYFRKTADGFENIERRDCRY